MKPLEHYALRKGITYIEDPKKEDKVKNFVNEGVMAFQYHLDEHGHGKTATAFTASTPLITATIKTIDNHFLHRPTDQDRINFIDDLISHITAQYRADYIEPVKKLLKQVKDYLN